MALITLCQFGFTQDQDIKQQSKQLSDLKKTIKQKQLEKDKLMLKEKTYKREINSLNNEMKDLESKIRSLSQNIEKTKKNLESASGEYNKAYEKQVDWNIAILDEIDYYNKMTFTLAFEDDPVEYKVRQAALLYKKENFDNAARVVDMSSAEIKKWEKAQSDLIASRRRESTAAKQREKRIDESKKRLASTASRRAEIEKEIKNDNETAKAMQTLINKLSEAQKKKQAETDTVIRTPASSVQRKKQLPWPVDGRVTVRFGKSKHPELDTYVISNGIKIKAANSAQVKSVDSGTVVFAGAFRSYGKVVIIDHKDSYFSVYGQLDQILVKEDQRVSRGTVLARLGSGNNSVLYFEIRQNNIPDNPLLWLIKK